MDSRDVAALSPPLDSCVTAVAKRPSERADSAEAVDDVCRGLHDLDVHIMRTLVNVENVQYLLHDCPMHTSSTVGERFNALRERAGLSMEKLARAMGLAGRSGIQRYLEPHYDPEGGLPTDKLESAIAALVGKGSPPITQEEVLNLGGKLIQRVGSPAKPTLTVADLCSNAASMKAIVEGLLEGYDKTPAALRSHAPEVLAAALARVLLRISERPAPYDNPDAIREALIVAASMPAFPTQQ